MGNEEKITMAMNLLKTGIEEEEIVKRLRLQFKVSEKMAIGFLKLAKGSSAGEQKKNGQSVTKTEKKKEEPKVEKVKKEEPEPVHTENSATSEEKVEEVKKEEIPQKSELEQAREWQGEGSDIPCAVEVYGMQDLADDACQACKHDCPITFRFCGILTNKPKKAAVKTTTTENGEKVKIVKRKGAGFEKVQFIERLISEGTHTQKEIIELACNQFPEVKRITITTYVSDSKNPSEKYGFKRHGFTKISLVRDGKMCQEA